MDELIRVSPSGTVRTTFYSLTLAGRTEFRRMLDKGVALFQGRLGDETSEREIPNRYAHLNVLGLREIVQRVDELSFGVGLVCAEAGTQLHGGGTQGRTDVCQGGLTVDAGLPGAEQVQIGSVQDQDV